MAREINGTLYRIRGYSGVPHYVECENLYDLYCYIAEHWIMKGYPISSINRNKSGDYTELSPCDDVRHGYVTIEGGKCKTLING